MTKKRILIVAAICALAAGGAIGRAQQPSPAAAATPTFARDVAPILYANCVTCHRAGEAAPMSLLTYAEARPWARAIARQVADGIMPPWHADAPPGTFENERRLTADEKDILTRWAAGGAPEGDPAALPPRPAFADGWRLGTPDVILEMPEDYSVPARGKIEYEFFYIPTGLTETKWVQSIEIRPGDRSLVHHVLVSHLGPPDGRGDAAQGVRGVPAHNRLPPRRDERGISLRPQRRTAQAGRLLATYAPGTDPQVFRPGTALRLEPGGTLELQMHYTATGTAGTDRTKVGLIFASEPPREEILPAQFLNAQFTIPAGANDVRVDTQLEFLRDGRIWGLFPHTHIRGKRWQYMLALPDGTTTPLLSVPNYDFNWQTYYMFKAPIDVPRGARILASAWYDNSAANKANPDPAVDVGWGNQTWEEMQYTGLLYSIR